MTYEDDQDYVYGIAKLLLGDMVFGGNGAKNVKDFLYFLDNNKPVLLFLVGKVSAAYFFDSKFKLKMLVSIHVELITKNCGCAIWQLMQSLTTSIDSLCSQTFLIPKTNACHSRF